MANDRPVGPAVGLPRVYGLDPVQKLPRRRIVLGVNVMVSEQQEAAHMPAVLLERGSQRGQHEFLIARRIRPGQSEMQVRVIRQLFEPLLEDPGCERKIVLFQSEISRRQVNLAQLRIGLFDPIVKLVQHHLGVHPAEQGDSAADNQVPGIAINPAAARKEPLDFSRQPGRRQGLPNRQISLSRGPA